MGHSTPNMVKHTKTMTQTLSSEPNEYGEIHLHADNADDDDELAEEYLTAHVKVTLGGTMNTEGVIVDGLPDTGANVSAIREDTYLKYFHGKPEYKRLKSLPGLGVKIGDGCFIHPHGRIVLPVEIGMDKIITHVHIMTNLPYEVVLGSGYLVQTYALMNWTNGTYSFL